MADNKDEEHLHTPTNTQSENPPDEIIPDNDMETINPNQEIENMETHAQELHKAPGHGLKHYLFEFLMLFLAVFCGFLAENLREHMVEQQRAKVYAANLYEELKKDTAGINNIIQGIKIILSRQKLSNLPYTTSIDLYSSANTTIDQLKSSGNLRIMGNNISQLINVYGKKLSTLESEYRLTMSEFAKIEELYFRIFDGYTIRLLLKDGTPQARDSVNRKPQVRDSVFKLNTPLINEDPALMKEFIGWLEFELHIYQSHIKNFLVPLKQTGTELIELLKKEYHLD